MNINHIKNGSLYAEEASGKVWRARAKANTSSVWVTHHDNKPELLKAENLRMASEEETDSYLNKK